MRVVFLKCGYLCEDTTLLLHLCSRGVFLSFDGIGCGGVYLADVDVSFPGDERLAKSLARLIRAGAASQLLLCHGYKYRMLLRSGGGSGLEHLPLRFLERLRREVGPEGQAAIADMTRGNLVGVLTYYLQPPPPKIEVKVWHCDACKKQFPAYTICLMKKELFWLPSRTIYHLMLNIIKVSGRPTMLQDICGILIKLP